MRVPDGGASEKPVRGRWPGLARGLVFAAVWLAIGLRMIPAAGNPPPLRGATADEILRAVRASEANVVLVNVWATWCLPCREEFPDLMKLYRAYEGRGLDLILVSGDFSDDRVELAGEFLASQGVDFPSFLKEGDDMKFIDTLAPRWTGALPATLIYTPDGVLRDFWEGKADYARMERAIAPWLEGRAPHDAGATASGARSESNGREEP